MIRPVQFSNQIVRVRKAGPDHRVLTLKGSRNPRSSRLYPKVPCPECPWRRKNMGMFPAQAFRHSAETALDMSNHVFACHSSPIEDSKICTGFLLRGAVHNLAVRLMYIQGKLQPPAEPECELFESYRDMAQANGVASDDPALEYTR